MPANSVKRRILSALVLLAFAALPALAADEAPVTWNLAEIYPTNEAWEAAREDLVGKTDSLAPYKGRLGESAATLEEFFGAMFELQKQASRLAGYAGMLGDEDVRESGPQGMRQSLRSLFADFSAANAWVDPELLSIDPPKLQGFLRERKGLSIYARYLERLEKQRKHVLDERSEEILGMSQRIRGVGNTVGGLLRNAEIPWGTVTLEDGSELAVNVAGYSKGRRSQNRADRITVFESFYTDLGSFKGSLAATLSGTVQEHVFSARVRNYDSTLHASLAGNEVDIAVYKMLVQEMNASLPTLHRYLRLRAKIMGIDDLAYYDGYPALVPEVGSDYTWEKSKALMKEALIPLGQEYVDRLDFALNNGWVDVYPREGKRSGAYVNDSAYDVHPYMLLNHQDNYSSASTLAHESGHLMHSSYSQEAQPFPLADYAIFVAEVASTVNEVIMFRHLVARAGSEEDKLAFLGNFLEGLRTTVFRQTMFAEFELTIHEKAEKGEPLTGDVMNEIYLELLRRYQGHEEGAMTIDELYAAEWSYVPHFHYNFYVYQYATSYIAAVALAEGITEKREGALERYLDFLKTGGTKPPVQLLQEAGVDMTSPEPIRAAMRLMNDVIDQIEVIIEK